MINNLIERMQIFFLLPKKYKKIFTHLTPKEKLLLFKLSKALPNNSTLLEIGSYLGASSCFLALGAKGKNCKVYCVDTFQNDAMTEGKLNTFDQFKKNTEEFQNFIKPLIGLSNEVSKKFSEKLDLIFFDGDHSYEGIKSDWDHWSSKFKKGTIVIFHDSGWAEGVKKVIEEEVTEKVTEEKKLPNMYWAKIK